MEIHDLRILDDILPLFDHTQSANGKMALKNILSTKLHSADEIKERQAILRGFMANIAIVRGFSYSGIYLHTTLSLTRRIAYEEPISVLDKLGSLVGVEKWKLKGAEISQFILLFNKLYSHYFKRLNFEAFPADYQKELNELRDTLNYFEPERYFSIIQNSGLGIRDTFKLHNKI